MLEVQGFCPYFQAVFCLEKTQISNIFPLSLINLSLYIYPQISHLSTNESTPLFQEALIFKFARVEPRSPRFSHSFLSLVYKLFSIKIVSPTPSTPPIQLFFPLGRSINFSFEKLRFPGFSWIVTSPSPSSRFRRFLRIHKIPSSPNICHPWMRFFS